MPLATGLWPFLVLLGLKLYVLSLLVPKTCVRMLAGYLALPSARLILGLRESLYKAERYFGPRILFSLMSHRDIGSQGQSNLFVEELITLKDSTLVTNPLGWVSLAIYPARQTMWNLSAM